MALPAVLLVWLDNEWPLPGSCRGVARKGTDCRTDLISDMPARFSHALLPGSASIKDGQMAAVMIGVDPHKGSHTAVAIDPAEIPLGELRVRAGASQAGKLLEWAAAWPDRTWAVEGAGGLGHLLAQQLLAAGEQVVDVQPKLGASLVSRRVPASSGTTPKASTAKTRSSPIFVGVLLWADPEYNGSDILFADPGYGTGILGARGTYNTDWFRLLPPISRCLVRRSNLQMCR
jgi:hypothetical protein